MSNLVLVFQIDFKAMFCPARALFTLHQFICTLLHYSKSHALLYFTKLPALSNITTIHLNFGPLHQATCTLLHYTKSTALCYIPPSHLSFITLRQVTYTLLHYTKSHFVSFHQVSCTLLHNTKSHFIKFHQFTCTLLHSPNSPAAEKPPATAPQREPCQGRGVAWQELMVNQS